MSVLGEIIARVAGTPFDQYVRDEIFGPLGMPDCWVGMPVDRYDAYGDRIGFMHVTSAGQPERLAGVDSARASAEPTPGANGRGPMNQRCRLYDMLVGNGTRNGVQLLGPVTVASFSARHRTEMRDETFGIVMDWGLGIVIDSYAMGRHSSRRAFGHGGHQSSVAFCDPEYDLVVAVVCNGMPGRERHHARLDRHRSVRRCRDRRLRRPGPDQAVPDGRIVRGTTVAFVPTGTAYRTRKLRPTLAATRPHHARECHVPS